MPQSLVPTSSTQELKVRRLNVSIEHISFLFTDNYEPHSIVQRSNKTGERIVQIGQLMSDGMQLIIRSLNRRP